MNFLDWLAFFIFDRPWTPDRVYYWAHNRILEWPGRERARV